MRLEMSRRNAMSGNYFVDRHYLKLGGFILDSDVSCRLEKIIRIIFGQRDPNCSMVKRLGRFCDPKDRLGYVTLLTPSGHHTLHYRPGTSDEWVIGQVLGTWDYDLTRLTRWHELHKLLSNHHEHGRRPLIVDAGANIGASTVFFSTTFPTSFVVAIEPEGYNFDLLHKNTKGLNVRCLKAALASKQGNATLINPEANHWAFRTHKVDTNEGVPCVTVNSIYEEFFGSDVYPFIVKIDIEGGEEDVFITDTEWVANTPVIIVELHDWMLPKKGTSRPFLRCISALDRDFVYLGENIFSLKNDVFEGMFS
jgi:FkbM family methyltransferase